MLDFRDIQTLPLRTVERMVIEGTITEETWKRYAHVWQTSAPRLELRMCDCETCREVFSHIPLTNPSR